MVKNPVDATTTQRSFVVTAVFVKQITVQAKSVSHAQDVAESQGLLTTDGKDLSVSNWHGHEVARS